VTRTEPRKILVLDDEALIAMEVEAILEDAGYALAGPAADVPEALALLQDGPIDGAILDLEVDGQRSDPVADKLADLAIPFIYLTGHPESALAERHRDARVVSKPFIERSLLRELALALEHRSA
jgi:CheY-like chemotaxis protein